ncbi:hypothetical protein ACFFYR_21545 [Paraburkholderia dipogonis]|uniref:hypothetical protein n=1 Tax=Paraburkholderia dipogonis TaxID=1211383 RepID=UPI0035ED1778
MPTTIANASTNRFLRFDVRRVRVVECDADVEREKADDPEGGQRAVITLDGKVSADQAVLSRQRGSLYQERLRQKPVTQPATQ